VTEFDSAFWTSLVIDAAVASAVTFLLAFGLFVSYGMFRVVNMAHGDMVMAGAYVASAAQSAGSGFVLAVIAAAATVAAIAFAMERICIGRLRNQSALATLLSTWGFGLVISQSVRLMSGSGGRYVDPPFGGQIEILGAPYASYQIALLGVACSLFALTWYLLARTGRGTRFRACMDNHKLAELQGINTRLLFSATFAVAGAFAGIAGALLAPISAINPDVGSGFSVSAFMVLITGGLGSVTSAAFGSLVVGGAHSMIGAFTTATAAKLALLVIVAVILMFRRRDPDFD
jgi:urea transport system permease protein